MPPRAPLSPATGFPLPTNQGACRTEMPAGSTQGLWGTFDRTDHRGTSMPNRILALSQPERRNAQTTIPTERTLCLSAPTI